MAKESRQRKGQEKHGNFYFDNFLPKQGWLLLFQRKKERIQGTSQADLEFELSHVRTCAGGNLQEHIQIQVLEPGKPEKTPKAAERVCEQRSGEGFALDPQEQSGPVMGRCRGPVRETRRCTLWKTTDAVLRKVEFFQSGLRTQSCGHKVRNYAVNVVKFEAMWTAKETDSRGPVCLSSGSHKS